MRKYKYLVLGTGVGKAIAYYLANCEDTQSVFLADKTYDEAVAAVRLLPKSTARVEPLEIDVSKPIPLPATFLKGYDVIISALPARYNLRLTKLAIEAGTHFCDLGGIVEVTEEQLKLGQAAIAKNVSILPDCGLMPGLGMILAQLLISEFKQTNELIIYAGGLPQKPIPPTYYQLIYSTEGLEHVCYDKPTIIENGELKTVEPFSGYEKIKVKELTRFGFDGVVEAFSTAGASISPQTFLNLGVKNFSEQTVRWSGFVGHIKQIPRSEFGIIMNRLLKPTTLDNPDLVWMEVSALGIDRNGQEVEKKYSMLDLFDPKTNFTAMERTTGFSTAETARMAAQENTLPGVLTPDCALSFKQMSILMRELESKGNIKIKKT